MSTLEQTQQAMMLAIDEGPAHLPPGLFAGSASRMIAGMKVHANTISHARLVALEESFPRVLQLLGHAIFNHYSREFLARPEAVGLALADIGRTFPEFIASREEVAFAATLASFDWLWLKAFRAPDARPLVLADLAGIPHEELPLVILEAHPAAWLVAADRHVRDAVGSALDCAGETEWFLLVRPEDQVRVLPASADMRSILIGANLPASIGNLLAISGEQESSPDSLPDASMQALIALIEAGALRGAGE